MAVQTRLFDRRRRPATWLQRRPRREDVRDEVEGYYQTVSQFIEYELAERGDERFWHGLGREHASGAILELGAGSGRVTELLAASGATVVAVDLSPEMLDLARRRHTGRSNVRLVQADMRDLALRRRFDLVVAADDPFSHLTHDADRDRALDVVARHLAPAGRFILDALWLSPKAADHAAQPSGRQDERTVSMAGRPLKVAERWQCDRRTRVCLAVYEYELAGTPAGSAEFEARYWTLPELRERLTRAGLALHACWGSYGREPWDESRAEQLVILACRP